MLGLGGGLSFGGAPSAPIPNPIRNAISLVADDYITFPLSTSTYWRDIFRGTFSFGMWVKPTDGHADGATEGQPNVTQGIFGLSNYNGTGNYTSHIIQLFIEGDGKLSFKHQSNTYGSYTEKTDAVVFVNGQNDWVHVLVVSELNEGSNTDNKIYINGELEATTASGSLSSAEHKLFYAGASPKLGAIDGLTMAGMVGNVDDFAFWDADITAAEAAGIYNSRKPFDLNAASSDGVYTSTNAGDLQVYLRMGDGTNDNISPTTGEEILIINQALNTGVTDVVTNGNFSSSSKTTDGGGLDTYSGWKEEVAGEITIIGDFLQITQTVVANGNATAVALTSGGSSDILLPAAIAYRLKYKIQEKGPNFVGLSAHLGGTVTALPEVAFSAGVHTGINIAYLTSGTDQQFKLINEHVADETATNCYVILDDVSLEVISDAQFALGVSGLDTETYNDLA